MLTVQHLSVLHNRDLRPLIRDLSFTLAGTERLAVIGEEGNGIRDFPGAVICVTHDRLLMDQWPGRVLRLTAEGLVEQERGESI